MKRLAAFTIALIAAGAMAGSASALAPVPVAANGNTAEVFAKVGGIPTQIAFGGGNTFIAAASEGDAVGGLYVVKKGASEATPVPGTPKNVFGVLWKSGRLYVTQNTSLVAYGKWNGKRFKQRKTLVKGPKTGLSGLAMSPDKRLYTGVQLKQEFDHKANPMKYANTVLSVKTNGKGLRVESRGIRQPWMLAFAKGERAPIVSNLAQDLPEGVNAPDYLVKAKRGSNFGFPKCNWAVPADCKGYAKPLLLFPKTEGLPASSPMGLAADGRKIYVALFGGASIVTTNASGAEPKPAVTGFGPPVLSVALKAGHLYAGDVTGTIYRVKL